MIDVTVKKIGNLQATLDAFSKRDANHQAFQGGWRTFAAFKPVPGPGEASFDINFPYYFAGMPAFTYGFSMERNQSLFPGMHPEHSATVFRWALAEAATTEHEGIYIGATVSVVLLGPPVGLSSAFNAAGRFHLQFSGHAVASPVGNIDGLTTEDSV